jgi:dihydrofolate reductase
MSMSLDGFIDSDRGHPGVAIPEGAELKQWKLDRISKAGAHLMGRVTYQQMSSYWPQSDDPYAVPMNDIPKVVFSKTLSDAEATWPVTQVARGDLATEIAALKAEPGPDVIVWGGGRFAGALAAADLIDEYRLLVQPLVLGQGRGTVRPAAGLAAHEPRRGLVVSQRHRGARLPAAAHLRREGTMGKVVAQAIMSLDGYVAKQDNTIGRLFDWLQNGEVEIPTPAGDFAVHLTPPSSEHWRRWVSSLGALVCGRTLFEVAEGWQGRHTLDVPVVVVTHRVPTDWVDAHPEAPFTFVTDGVAAAVAHALTLAGDRDVAVTGGTIARQCLDLGLLDEVAVDLVPVVMGEGSRPFFGRLSADDVLLGNPSVCVQGDRVTHLVFPVVR